MKTKYLFTSFFMVVSFFVFLGFARAEEAHKEEHHIETFGDQQAITEVLNDGEGFKISEKSESFLNIKFDSLPLEGGSLFRIPKDSLVSYQDQFGVFVKRDGWISLLSVEKIKDTSEFIFIKSKHLHPGEEIAVSGAAFLRIAYLQVSGAGGEGHAH